jgi:hypothetical protein
MPEPKPRAEMTDDELDQRDVDFDTLRLGLVKTRERLYGILFRTGVPVEVNQEVELIIDNVNTYLGCTVHK